MYNQPLDVDRACPFCHASSTSAELEDEMFIPLYISEEGRTIPGRGGRRDQQQSLPETTIPPRPRPRRSEYSIHEDSFPDQLLDGYTIVVRLNTDDDEWTSDFTAAILPELDVDVPALDSHITT